MLLSHTPADCGQAGFGVPWDVLLYGYSGTQGQSWRLLPPCPKEKERQGRGRERERKERIYGASPERVPRTSDVIPPLHAYCGQSSVLPFSWQQGNLGRKVVYLSAQREIEIEFGEPSVSCGEEVSQKEEGDFPRAQRALQPEMNCRETPWKSSFLAVSR